MSVELDYSTFVLLPGAVNPLIGMMMETDMWGTTIIVQDKQDGSAKQKLSATASEFISSWDSFEQDEGVGADVMDDGGADYFDQQEQDELLHGGYEPVDAMNENFSSFEEDSVSHLWSRRGSLEGESYGGSSRHSSRSTSPSPSPRSNPPLARAPSDPFGVSHFANVTNSQLLQHQQLPLAQPQRLRQQQLLQQQQLSLQPPQSSRQPGRVQQNAPIPPGRVQGTNGAASSFIQQRFQPQNVSPPTPPQSPQKLSRIASSNDPRTLRPPANRSFYRPPRETVRLPQNVPSIRSRMPESYGWTESY